MNRYLLFSSKTYYSGGGWNDFCGSFDSVKDAATKALSLLDDPDQYAPDWAHVIDAATESKVLKLGSPDLSGHSIDVYFVALNDGQPIKSWSSEAFYADKHGALDEACRLISEADKT